MVFTVNASIVNAGILCVCADVLTAVTAVLVEESFADVANVPVEVDTDCVVEPVVPVGVVASLLEAEAITAEAAIPVVAAPIELMFVPKPSGTRSLKSGTLKLEEPSPTPKEVPIVANSLAYVDLLIAASLQANHPVGAVVFPKATIVPAGTSSIPPAAEPSCKIRASVSVSTVISPTAPVKPLFCDVVPRLNCN